MKRTVPALVATCGVLVMSMPGGICFLWAGLGVEHHHHEDFNSVEPAASCFHEHDCDYHGEGPSEPCDSEEYILPLVGSNTFKFEFLVLPEGIDFSFDWTKATNVLLTCLAKNVVAPSWCARFDVLPPPAEVRLCRFLI